MGRVVRGPQAGLSAAPDPGAGRRRLVAGLLLAGVAIQIAGLLVAAVGTDLEGSAIGGHGPVHLPPRDDRVRARGGRRDGGFRPHPLAHARDRGPAVASRLDDPHRRGLQDRGVGSDRRRSSPPASRSSRRTFRPFRTTRRRSSSSREAAILSSGRSIVGLVRLFRTHPAPPDAGAAPRERRSRTWTRTISPRRRIASSGSTRHGEPAGRPERPDLRVPDRTRSKRTTRSSRSTTSSRPSSPRVRRPWSRRRSRRCRALYGAGRVDPRPDLPAPRDAVVRRAARRGRPARLAVRRPRVLRPVGGRPRRGAGEGDGGVRRELRAPVRRVAEGRRPRRALRGGGRAGAAPARPRIGRGADRARRRSARGRARSSDGCARTSRRAR